MLTCLQEISFIADHESWGSTVTPSLADSCHDSNRTCVHVMCTLLSLDSFDSATHKECFCHT